ncbi:MAG: hypothetical protein DRI69_06085 [Bacteroidetes bacterium]|nr:MAG: hypothetical protein DRI69_06085 [Bacteroidota bacterium]
MEQKIFTNQQVDLSTLPSADDLHFTPLEKNYRRLQYIISVIVTVVVLIGLVILFWLVNIPTWIAVLICGFWIFIGLLILVFIKEGYTHKGYAVRARDLVYKTGWLYKKQVTVPFSRIQHVDIKQGVLERKYKLSNLNLYTAGGASSDLTIPGINIDDAKRFKSFILGVMESDEEE